MSQSLASITLVGRLTRDAELKYTQAGDALCHFTIATDSRVKKDGRWIDEPSYWDVDLWGKRAESLNQYLVKGKLVAMVGPIRQERWEKDGAKHQKDRVNADDVQLLGDNGSARQEARQNPPNRTPETAGARRDDSHDDIPF